MQNQRFLIKSRHGSRWYVRVHIPQHLRHFFDGRREIRKTTKQTNKRQAGRVALQFWAQCQALFGELESRMPKEKEETLKSGLTIFEDIFGQKITVDHGTGPEAAKLERQAVAEHQQRTFDVIKQFKGEPEIVGAMLARTPAPQADPNAPETVMTWEELFTRYEARERQRVDNPADRLTESSYRTYAPHRRLWGPLFKGRKTHTITRQEVQDVELWLQRLPLNYIKRGFNDIEAIELAKKGNHDLEVVSPGSYNNYQRQIVGLLKYAFNQGAHRQDLSSLIPHMNTKRAKRNKRCLPFSNDDMAAMFNCDYVKNLGAGYNKTPTEARFWVPLIGALSGARIGEICQLKVSDIRYSDEAECHYMHIIGDDELASDGKAKKIKNINSIRPIPVHPELLKIGFLEYVESMRTHGEEASLFKLERNNADKFGDSIGKWFSRKTGSPGFVERCGIEAVGVFPNDQKWYKAFHSYRHTVVDNLRHEDKRLPDGARVTESDRALTVGHLDEKEQSLETRNYGQGVTYIKLRRDVIGLISYPGVDFESIKWPTTRHTT